MVTIERAVINVTDQRIADDRRLRDHLLAASHVDDPFTGLDWTAVDHPEDGVS